MTRVRIWFFVLWYIFGVVAVAWNAAGLRSCEDGRPFSTDTVIATGIIWPVELLVRIAVWSVDPSAARVAAGCGYVEAAR